MATTLDQVLNQEQLHYQVIKQNIDNLYLNLNSSNNAQTNNIVNALNNATNNLGGQLYTQSNRVIQDLSGQAITLEQEILNTTRGLFNVEASKIDSAVNLIYQKLDANLSNILEDIDKRAGITVAEIMVRLGQLYDVTVNVGGEVKDLQLQIEGNLDRAILDVTKHDKENADRLLGIINDNIESGNKALTKDIQSTSNALLGQLQGFGGSEPQFLTDALEKLYSAIGSGNKNDGDDFITSLIRLVSGNATADTMKLIGKADPLGEILKQITNIGAIEENVLKGKYKTVDDLNNDLKRIGVSNGLIGGLVQLAFAIGNIGEIFKILGSPVLIKSQQFVNSAYSLKQLTENDYLQALIRNNMSASDVKANLDNLGHSQEDSELLMHNAAPKLSPEDILKLAHLGKISPSDVPNRLRELGYNEIDAVNLGYIFQPRPGINDLIQFAVKEVYSPDVAQKFGQYQDFPKTFGEQAKLLGLSEEYAQQYWAAHWQLPGAVMGYDMLHRRIITKDDLQTLLKSLDVMPFWRDKLIQLSYNVVARVDTRRLYAYGIWDKQKVYENYLDEGYSPKDAQDLTTFAVMYDDEQDNKHKTALQNKAKNVYIKAFNNNLQTFQQAKDNIVRLGYKAQDVDLELNIEKYEEYVDSHKPRKQNHVAKIIQLSLDGYRKRSVGRQDLLDTLQANGYSLPDAISEADFVDKEANLIFKETVVKQIQALYFESLYSDNDVLNQLTKIGFNNNEVLQIISELQILKSLDTKKPTPAQFKTMFEDGIINQEQYVKILQDMGYNMAFIPQLIALSVGKDK